MLDRLHPELRAKAATLTEIVAFERENHDPEALAAALETKADWREAWQWAMAMLEGGRVTGLNGSAFVVPFLDPGYCQQLVAHSVRLGNERGYMPNLEEDLAYQIPEIVLRECAEDLHNEIADLIGYLGIWFTLVYQTEPKRFTAIQFAKYEPTNTSHGNWHHDEDSDFTAVVSLNPGAFEGGGTDLRLSPTTYVSMPPLPQGFILMFNGRLVQHRGRAVTLGARHLLVLWMVGHDDEEAAEASTTSSDPDANAARCAAA